MSIIYKLLGIPRTLEEFLDREKNNGATVMDIKVNRYTEEVEIAPPELHTEVRLCSRISGRSRRTLKGMIYPFENDFQKQESLIGQNISLLKQETEKKGLKTEVFGYKEKLQPYDPQKVRGLMSELNKNLSYDSDLC